MQLSMRGRIFAFSVAIGLVGVLGTACEVPPIDPPPGSGPSVGGCQMLPADNPWNQKVTGLAVRSDSSSFISSISASGKTNLHPDFGGDGAYGIPYAVVPASQPKVPIDYQAYGDESDPGRSRSRRAHPSKVAARATATGTCWWSSREAATCTSSGARSGRATTGTPTSV